MVEARLSEQEKPLFRAYHWANTLRVSDVWYGRAFEIRNKEGFLVRNEAGLMPRTLVEGKGPYIFCLMGSPYPIEWQKHSELFKQLVITRRALFQFDVYPTDDAHIAEVKHAIPYFNEHGKTQGFSRTQEYKDYLESIIPFSEYKGNYELPEILIPTHINRERLQGVMGGLRIVDRVVGQITSIDSVRDLQKFQNKSKGSNPSEGI